MNTLDRYIFRSLSVSLGVSTIALLLLIWVINSLKFLDWFVNKGLSLWTFMEITLLLMPGFLTVFLPIALFAVTLFVYSRLTSDRELVAMRSSGMGSWRLARPALVLCAIMTLFGYVLTLSMVPRLEAAFDDIKVQVRDDISAVVLREGQFSQVDHFITVFLGQRNSDGSLSDLLIYDTSTPGKSVTILAEKGALLLDDGPARFVLINGNRQEWNRESRRATFLYFDSYTLQFGQDTEAVESRPRKENQRPFWDLIFTKVGDQVHPDFPNYTFTQSNILRFRLEAHQRALKPLNHLGFVLIALGAVLSSSFKRRGGNNAALLALVMIILFQAANLGTASLAKRSFSGILLFDVSVILPILIGALWVADAPRRFLDWRQAAKERAVLRKAAKAEAS